MSEHRWERFAKQLEEERNPARIGELAKELNEAMLTEGGKVRNRLNRMASDARRIIDSGPVKD